MAKIQIKSDNSFFWMNIFNDETIIYYKSHGSPMEEGMMCEIFGVTYKNDKILHVIQLFFCIFARNLPFSIKENVTNVK